QYPFDPMPVVIMLRTDDDGVFFLSRVPVLQVPTHEEPMDVLVLDQLTFENHGGPQSSEDIFRQGVCKQEPFDRWTALQPGGLSTALARLPEIRRRVVRAECNNRINSSPCEEVRRAACCHDGRLCGRYALQDRYPRNARRDLAASARVDQSGAGGPRSDQVLPD